MKSEKRFLRRTEFHKLDKMTAVIISNNTQITCNLIEFNSFGLSISKDENNANIKCGTHFNIKIFQNNNYIGQFKDARVVHENNFKICFKAIDSISENNNNENRSEKRFSLSVNGQVKIIFENPIYFNDNITVNINELSLNGGSGITSARNRNLINDTQIENVKIYFHEQEITTSIRISNVNICSDKSSVRIGFVFTNNSLLIKQVIFSQIMRFSTDVTPELFFELRSSLDNMKLIKDFIEYDICRTDEDYNSILKLRHQAYGRVGKVEQQKTWEEMADEFDSRSILIIAKLKGQIVGSGRLTLAGLNDTFELESSIKLPTKISEDRTKVLEVSRLCINDNFLGTNITHGIFEWGFQYIVKSQVKWVISSTEKHLIYMYKKIGFTISKSSFDLVTLKGKPHYFMYGQVKDVLQGNMNLIAWNISFGNILKYLNKKKYINTHPFVKVKHRIATVLSRIVLKIISTNQSKKHIKQNTIGKTDKAKSAKSSKNIAA